MPGLLGLSIPGLGVPGLGFIQPGGFLPLSSGGVLSSSSIGRISILCPGSLVPGLLGLTIISGFGAIQFQSGALPPPFDGGKLLSSSLVG